MDDDDFYATATLTKGYFVGQCFRCREPSTGGFNFDEESATIQCVNCGAKDVVDVKDLQLELTVIGGDRA